MRQPFDTDAYRYPNEYLILAVTLFLVLVVIVVTATATLCGSAIFVVAMVALAVWFSSSKHSQLISHAQKVRDQNLPGLDAVVRDGIARLRPTANHETSNALPRLLAHATHSPDCGNSMFGCPSNPLYPSKCFWHGG
jgi:hypothetical protein